ncbi:CvfB family protein [Virgibacillus senegalensis]|uniref:CvfB family protein n=1 Tax=Virgibacillus senegalensis TaxID=1499679 RepID=UPI00069D5D35|nr:S1-like domain-containing RNA-binding protein [Virgibacillus senegalensis]
MKELQPGSIQRAEVTQEVTDGFLLRIGKETLLLPETEKMLQPQQEIEVFVYQDKKGRALATTTIPEARIDSYGWASVVEVVENLGVFVDIGIPKEILVSSDDLPLLTKVWPKNGDNLFVSLAMDKKGRLLAKPIGEADVIADLEPASSEYLQKQVIGRVYRSTKAGSFILTEEGFRGFIHPNERKKEPRVGETVTGRVIDVKDDGTINVTLLPLKQEGIKDDAAAILEYLEKSGGSMSLGDKSDPEIIRETFHISKAAFKRALGKLIKEGKVYQQDGNTHLK